MFTKEKIVGVIIGLGFALPSVRGFLFPVESAMKWQLALTTQAAIEQYRTLAILVFAIGVSICIGSLKEATQRYALYFASLLIVSLLFGRLVSTINGSVTNMLLIETVVEFSGLLFLVWVLRNKNA